MRRRSLLALALAAAARPARAQNDGPEAPIATFNDALLKIMRAGRKTPFAARAQIIAPVIERVFDLRQILATSVGPRWAGFPPPQQEALREVFTRYTVASYVANFDGFNGERLEILPQPRVVGNDEVVATKIVPTSGTPTRMDYVMRRTPEGWQVVDILLDGAISRVAVQRSDFRSLLVSGDPGPLIASLRSKTAALEAGGKS